MSYFFQSLSKLRKWAINEHSNLIRSDFLWLIEYLGQGHTTFSLKFIEKITVFLFFRKFAQDFKTLKWIDSKGIHSYVLVQILVSWLCKIFCHFEKCVFLNLYKKTEGKLKKIMLKSNLFGRKLFIDRIMQFFLLQPFILLVIRTTWALFVSCSRMRFLRQFLRCAHYCYLKINTFIQFRL